MPDKKGRQEMIWIRESRDEDREKLLACANGAFGEELPPGGFGTLLPKLYGPRASVGGNHLIAGENDEILGLVLAEPMKYRVWKERLKIAAIGTVGVAAKARGRGIMKRLMTETISRLRQEGFDLAFLGGQRQRYAYWGFEACGTQMRFHWNQANLRHSAAPAETDRMELIPMEPGSDLCREAWRLWNREPVRVERDRERFFDILCSWQGRPYACMCQGKFAGYGVFSLKEGNETGRIQELILEEGVPVSAVLHALDACLGIKQGDIAVDFSRQELLSRLEEICEYERLECGHRFLILDWPKVLLAMLELKRHYRPLQDGEAVLGITETDGKRRIIQIHIQKGRIRVTEREELWVREREQAIYLELSAAQAERMLFRDTLVHYKELERLPEGWFPLPLYVSEQDCC